MRFCCCESYGSGSGDCTIPISVVQSTALPHPTSVVSFLIPTVVLPTTHIATFPVGSDPAAPTPTVVRTHAGLLFPVPAVTVPDATVVVRMSPIVPCYVGVDPTATTPKVVTPNAGILSQSPIVKVPAAIFAVPTVCPVVPLPVGADLDETTPIGVPPSGDAATTAPTVPMSSRIDVYTLVREYQVAPVTLTVVSAVVDTTFKAVVSDKVYFETADEENNPDFLDDIVVEFLRPDLAISDEIEVEVPAFTPTRSQSRSVVKGSCIWLHFLGRKRGREGDVSAEGLQIPLCAEVMPVRDAVPVPAPDTSVVVEGA